MGEGTPRPPGAQAPDAQQGFRELVQRLNAKRKRTARQNAANWRHAAKATHRRHGKRGHAPRIGR